MNIIKGDRIEQNRGGKTGTATGDQHPDPYGYGTQVVPVQWDNGRNSYVQTKNVHKIDNTP